MRNEVSDLGFVTERPQQSISSRVGLGLLADLRDPLVALSVFNAILSRESTFLLFDKSEPADIRLHLFAAGAENQITTLEIGRLVPHDRVAGEFLLFGL